MSLTYDRYNRAGVPDFDDFDERDDRYASGAEAGDDNAVPDVVKTFVAYLYRHVRERNVLEIHQMYETSFNKLSARFFVESPWPSVDAIAPVVDGDHVFCLLYKEMYYRHIYARLQPTLQQRCDSWENYCNLFQVVLLGSLNVQLPNQWLWDMLDEFIYQFQSFCQFRAKVKSRTDEELAMLKQCGHVWNVYGVLNYLRALVEKSGIVDILDDDTEGGAAAAFTASEGYDLSASTPTAAAAAATASSNVLRMLGYFALPGLLRVHCLLGDYHTALVRAAPIDVGRPGVFQRIIGCHITVMYHHGFACMMQRRYVEAVRAFNAMLLTIARTRQFHEASPHFDQIMKKNEQLLALLAVSLALCPGATSLVEEGVMGQLRDKLGEKVARLQRGDEASFDEHFSFACPKFVTPAPPADPEAAQNNYNQDAYRLQLSMFLADVRCQVAALPGLRSALSLYSRISLAKLASLLDVDQDSIRTTLMTLRHKSHAIDSDGVAAPTPDVDFVIDSNLVEVVERKATRKFGDYFIRHIIKFDEIVSELVNVQFDI